MTFGVYLTTNDGRQFLTEDAVPVNLLSKVAASGSGSASASLAIDSSMINIPFMLSDAVAYHTYAISGNTMNLTSAMKDNSGGTVNMQAYIFSVKPPVPPAWGLSIWDKNSNCILTNETRVLRDINEVGSKGVAASGGININVTKPGKWAIIPEIAGNFAGVYQGGPVVVPQLFYAMYNGTNTVISSILASTLPSGIQGSITNSQNSVRAIDASLYE